MASPWPSEECRESYIEFLTLELRVMQAAAAGGLDEDLLAELEALLTAGFPRTRAFIESRLSEDPARGFSDEVRTVAWAEARARSQRGDKATVEGDWTPSEIAADINECFREALFRAGMRDGR